MQLCVFECDSRTWLDHSYHSNGQDGLLVDDLVDSDTGTDTALKACMSLEGNSQLS